MLYPLFRICPCAMESTSASSSSSESSSSSSSFFHLRHAPKFFQHGDKIFGYRLHPDDRLVIDLPRVSVDHFAAQQRFDMVRLDISQCPKVLLQTYRQRIDNLFEYFKFAMDGKPKSNPLNDEKVDAYDDKPFSLKLHIVYDIKLVIHGLHYDLRKGVYILQ